MEAAGGMPSRGPHISVSKEISVRERFEAHRSKYDNLWSSLAEAERRRRSEQKSKAKQVDGAKDSPRELSAQKAPNSARDTGKEPTRCNTNDDYKYQSTSTLPVSEAEEQGKLAKVQGDDISDDTFASPQPTSLLPAILGGKSISLRATSGVECCDGFNCGGNCADPIIEGENGANGNDSKTDTCEEQFVDSGQSVTYNDNDESSDAMATSSATNVVRDEGEDVLIDSAPEQADTERHRRHSSSPGLSTMRYRSTTGSPLDESTEMSRSSESSAESTVLSFDLSGLYVAEEKARTNDKSGNSADLGSVKNLGDDEKIVGSARRLSSGFRDAESDSDSDSDSAVLLTNLSPRQSEQGWSERQSSSSGESTTLSFDLSNLNIAATSHQNDKEQRTQERCKESNQYQVQGLGKRPIGNGSSKNCSVSSASVGGDYSSGSIADVTYSEPRRREGYSESHHGKDTSLESDTYDALDVTGSDNATKEQHSNTKADDSELGVNMFSNDEQGSLQHEENSSTTSEEEWKSDFGDSASESSGSGDESTKTKQQTFNVIILSDDEEDDDESEVEEEEEDSWEPSDDSSRDVSSGNEVGENQHSAPSIDLLSDSESSREEQKKIRAKEGLYNSGIDRGNGLPKNAPKPPATKKTEIAKTPSRSLCKKTITARTPASCAAFARSRDKYKRAAFSEFNSKVFGNSLSSVEVSWSKRLVTTAGITRLKRVGPSNNRRRTAVIELSAKVIDDNERLRSTLLHEMCHAAAWLIDNVCKPPHGACFKKWAAISMRKIKGVEVTTTHDYVISYKYAWACTNKKCGAVLKRHSRSIDVKKQCCGRCKSALIEIEVPGGKNDKSEVGYTPKQKRKASGFSLFVQKNSASVRDKLMRERGSSGEKVTQSQVMKECGRLWREQKNAPGRESLTVSSDEKENRQVDDNVCAIY